MKLRWLITITDDEDGEGGKESIKERELQYWDESAVGLTGKGDWVGVPVRTETYRTEEGGVQKLVEVTEVPS